MIDIDIAQQLFPNPATMIVQLCATGILFAVASKFLWKPARNFMETRSSFIQSKLEHVEKNYEESEDAKKQAYEEVSHAYHKSQEIIAKAEEEAKLVKEEILKEANKDATLKLEKAREEIAIEKTQMREGMVEEMVSVALLATEKLLGEKVDSSQDQQAIEQFVKEMSNPNGPIS